MFVPMAVITGLAQLIPEFSLWPCRSVCSLGNSLTVRRSVAEETASSQGKVLKAKKGYQDKVMGGCV